MIPPYHPKYTNKVTEWAYLWQMPLNINKLPHPLTRSLMSGSLYSSDLDHRHNYQYLGSTLVCNSSLWTGIWNTSWPARLTWVILGAILNPLLVILNDSCMSHLSNPSWKMSRYLEPAPFSSNKSTRRGTETSYAFHSTQPLPYAQLTLNNKVIRNPWTPAFHLTSLLVLSSTFI